MNPPKEDSPPASELIQNGLAHQHAGRLQEAEAIYQSILQEQPQHAGAWHLLGLIAHQVNGQRGSVGGTADSIGLWDANAVPVTILAPQDGSVVLAERPHRQTPIGLRRIMAMVKADVVGYSQLSEKAVANYFQHVLPQVASLCGKFNPVVQDTFGDAFYFVFESVERACRFAFALQSLFRSTHLTIRIATHAGPLLECYDPVRGAVNYTGRHASRVSRVEPVADENQILATQQIAALIAVHCPHHFELAYTGERILPKGFGSERLYVLTPGPTRTPR